MVFTDRLVVVDGTERTSYATFAEHVFRLASALRRRGLSRGDRVAVLCRNCREFLEAHFAIPQAGGILVPINVRLIAPEVAYIVRHSEARFALVDRQLSSLWERSCESLDSKPLTIWVDLESRHGMTEPGAGKGTGTITYEELLSEGEATPFIIELEDEEETISINYTSGTTGQPKGVMVTHRGCYLNALAEIIEVQLTSESIYLWTLPMFHCNGWNFPWAVTAVGAVHVCLPRVEPAQVFRLIEQEGVTHFCAAPTVLLMLIEERPTAQYRFPRPVTVVTAASPPPPTVLQALEQRGARVIHVYGLTETYGPHTICEWWREWDQYPAEERARLKARQGGGLRARPRAARGR
jgi:fatty-acyl-CoA synthase